MNNYFQNYNKGRNEMKPGVWRLEDENKRLTSELKEAIELISYYSTQYDNGIKAAEFLKKTNFK